MLLNSCLIKKPYNTWREIPTKGKPISDSNTVDDILDKFRSKYGEADVKKYYPKADVAVEVPF